MNEDIFSGDLQPILKAHIIIDTRNVAGQAASVLGISAIPYPDGLEKAFGNIGIEVLSMSFGMAKVLRNESSKINTKVSNSGKLTRTLESYRRINETYRKRITSHGKSEVLEGFLKYSRTQNALGEKQVDESIVAAMDKKAHLIACENNENSCIILISDDSDLNPGFGLAKKLRIPAYRLTFQSKEVKKYKREGQLFIAADDVFLATACEKLSMKTGHDLRNTHCNLLFGKRKRLEWKLSSEKGKRKEKIMINSDAALALEDNDKIGANAIIKRYVNGFNNGDMGDLFPLLTLSPQEVIVRGNIKCQVVRRDLDEAVLEVLAGDMVGQKITVTCPLGGVFVGSTVLIRPSVAHKGKYDYIGALHARTIPEITTTSAQIVNITPEGLIVLKSREGKRYIAYALGRVHAVGEWYLLYITRDYLEGRPKLEAILASSPLKYYKA